MKAILFFLILTFLLIPKDGLAECAWVLWSKTTADTPTENTDTQWYIETAYPEFELCFAKQQALLSGYKTFLEKAGVKEIFIWPEDTIRYMIEKQIIYKKLICLPNDVNPNK